MKFQPTTATVKRGSTVTLKVVVDTKGAAVNAVQIVLTFPDHRLDCADFAADTAWPFLAARECTPSTAKIAVATPPGSPAFTGRATAATITLQATQQAGRAAVEFAPDGAVGGGCLVVSVEGVDVLGPTNSATIRTT